MRTLNTLHLSSLAVWDLKGGKGRVSTYLPLKGMVDNGCRVVFLTSNLNATTGDIDGIEVIKIWCPFRNSSVLIQFLAYPIIYLCYVIAALNCTRNYKPDVIYAHCIWTSRPAKLISCLTGAKLVIRLYGVGKGAIDKWRHFPSMMMRKRSLKTKADAYILTNDGTAADKFALSFGVPEDKIYFLKNGLKKDVEISRDEVLRQQYASPNERLIISVSRLSNWKQVDLIIKMMPELLKTDSVKLLVIGDGPERGNLHQLVEDLGIKDKVFFLGAKKQNEVYKYLCISDVFVSMNYLSSMSNPVYEAMLCSVPVVALNMGTTKDLITDQENGVLIEPDNLKGLPIKVHELLSDEHKRQDIGCKGRSFIMKNWLTWEERVALEMNIIEGLVKK